MYCVLFRRSQLAASDPRHYYTGRNLDHDELGTTQGHLGKKNAVPFSLQNGYSCLCCKTPSPFLRHVTAISSNVTPDSVGNCAGWRAYQSAVRMCCTNVPPIVGFNSRLRCRDAA